MRRRASSSGRRSKTKLSRIAEKASLSEDVLIGAFFERLDDGRLTECLDMSVQASFDDWVERNGLLDGRSFYIDLGISRKSMMRCLCFIDLSGDEPLVRVTRRIFASPSSRVKDGRACFDVQISSLDPREIFGYGDGTKEEQTWPR